MLIRRLLMLLALLMIGEALVALIHPRRYLHLWACGPAALQDMMESLRQKPELVRGLAVAELALGLAIALGDTQNGDH